MLATPLPEVVHENGSGPQALKREFTPVGYIPGRELAGVDGPTVADALANADPFHLIVKLTPGLLPGWESGGWVAVESFAEENQARDRFHDLRPVLESLRASSAVVRGIAQSSTQTLSHDKTVISRDAEFWTLHSAEIRIAGPDLIDFWSREAARLMAELAARDAARLAPRLAPRPVPKAGKPKRTAALAFGGAAVAMVVATTLAMRPTTPDPLSATTLARREGTTMLLPDPKDPNFTIEYELKPDGTRTVVARFPNGQRPEPQENGEAKRARTLADGVNTFLRVRQ